MLAEACVLWNPIPEPFNRNWQVDVVHLVEAHDAESYQRQAQLSLAIAAYREKAGEREDRAWRLDFGGVVAYRKRSTDHLTHLPIPSPDTQTALWEVSPSSYVLENVGDRLLPPDSRLNYAEAHLHHYVIRAAIHTLYEVLATRWSCEPLPPEWARPFSTDPFPRW